MLASLEALDECSITELPGRLKSAMQHSAKGKPVLLYGNPSVVAERGN